MGNYKIKKATIPERSRVIRVETGLVLVWFKKNKGKFMDTGFFII